MSRGYRAIATAILFSLMLAACRTIEPSTESIAEAAHAPTITTTQLPTVTAPQLPTATTAPPPTATTQAVSPSATSPEPTPLAPVPSPARFSHGAIAPETAAQLEIAQRLEGHSPGVVGLGFLPSGDQLAAVSSGFALKLWDLGTGQEVGGLPARGMRLYNAAFSPDGKLLATEGPDDSIVLWDVQSGHQVRTLRGHGTYLLRLTFSPDGSLLASSADDNSIKLWEVDSGREIQSLEGHITPVTALAFSPDGKLLASGGMEFSTIIKLWEIETGLPQRTLGGHTGNVYQLRFSPDGTLLASASADNTARIWQVKSGQVVHTLDGGENPVRGLAFSPDGKLLATSGARGTIKLWDTASGKELQTLVGHNDYVHSMAFSPDGSLLATAGFDSTVLVWGVPKAGTASSGDGGTFVTDPSVPVAEAPAAILPTSASNGLIAFSSYREGESQIYVMDDDGMDVTRISRTSLRETRPAWSPDGQRIAFVRRMGNSNHEIFVMDADGSNQIRLTDRPDTVESEPAWSPDGRQIAFISNERPSPNTVMGRFHIWIANLDGSAPRLLTDIGGSNTSPDWAPDGRRIAFDTTRDGNCEIYAIDVDGSHLVNLSNHPGHDTNPAWSPDGQRIAFVSDRDGNLEIYVMDADGSNQVRLTFSAEADKAPAWSPDGQYLLFYAESGKMNVEIYRMRADGSEQVRLTSHPDFDGFPTWQPRLPTALAAEGTEPAPQTTIDEQVDGLEGLPFGAFLDESFKMLMLRDPEWVTEDGLTALFGTNDEQLTDLSDAYVRETQQLQTAILAQLRTYDRDELSAADQISYDTYEWYLDDLVRGQTFMYHDYPITHFTTGIQYQLLYLFTDGHPVRNEQEARAYISRLSQVNSKFEGLIEGLRLRQEAGVVLPRFLFAWSMGDIRGIARSPARFTPFYTAFEKKVMGLELSAEKKKKLLEAAEQAIDESVIPAFAALEETLRELEATAPNTIGALNLPDGQAYYEYALHHFTTTDLTADEIHELGLKELARIQAEMRAEFAALGYPADESIPELYARLARESGPVPRGQEAETYEAIIEAAEAHLGEAFDIRPQAELKVVAGPEGDYYVSGSLDGSRPGAFYARVDGGKAAYGMATLTYHEAVPGHHFQISLAQESDLPLFRNVVGFLGYTEGWALYAEQLAYELGWYKDDPYGNLGRLQAQAFRAARLVVDTGIHAKGWSFDQALDFMVENVGRDRGFLEFEVSRYIAWPGQATAYMVGMLKLSELRQRAMEALGDRFDLAAFHRVVLTNGSMPLQVLERVVDDYIKTTAASPSQEGTGGLKPDEVTALGSLEQVDDHPLYVMRYAGDYEQRAQYTERRPMLTRDGQQPAWACSLFAALSDKEGLLLGRNFDWQFSPALLLFTDPPNGYASVSMVDIDYLGFGGDRSRNITDLPLDAREGLLDAPFLPFDGMNERGLAVGMAAVPPGGMQPDPDKASISSLGVIREMLDHAADVDEAVQILKSYNVDMGDGPPLHYLVADASGRAALIEFYQGEVVVTPNEEPWHRATNFLRAAAGASAEGQCWRYDQIGQRMAESGGRLDDGEAMDLLARVAQNNTQWSVVYGLHSGEIGVVLGRAYDKVYTFQLEMEGE